MSLLSAHFYLSLTLFVFLYLCRIASVKLTPGRTSAKDLQSVMLKDQPGRASALHHTFQVSILFRLLHIPSFSARLLNALQEGEHWLKMSMSLPQPILLHSIHIYQPMALSQSKYCTLYNLCYYVQISPV